MGFNLGDITATLTADTSKWKKSLDDAKSQLDALKKAASEKTAMGLTDAAANAKTQISGAKDAVTSAKKSLDDAKKSVADFKKGFEDIKNQAGEAVGNIANISTAIIAAGSALAAFAIKGAADFEQNSVSMQAFIGNTEKAKQVLKELGDMAKTTPMQFQDLVKYSAQLLGGGGATADNLLQRLHMLGDVAAGVGKDKLPQIVLAFNQIMTAGRMMGDDFRQLKNAMVPLMPELEKVTGRSAAEIEQDLNSGMVIPADLVLKAFQSMTSQGGKFFNMMAIQSKTAAGLWSNVQDAAGFAMRGLVGISQDGSIRVGGAFDLIKRALDGAQVFLNKINEITPQTQQKITSMAGAVLGTAAAFLGLIAVMKAIVLLSNPFMMVFALIAAVVGVKIYNALQTAQGSIKDTGKAATDMGSTVTTGSAAAGNAISKLSSDTVKKLQDIDKQMAKTSQDYLSSLADIIDGHEEAQASIESDIAKENADFAKSAEKQTASNKDKLDQMASDHQDKVDAISKQIDDENKKGKNADLSKLVDLRDSLDKENAAYQEATDKQKADNDQATKDALDAHQQVLTDLQVKLDKETTFLKKHEADIAAVKNVARLDEIEKLKQQTAEKMAQYQEDKQNAIQQDQAKTNEITVNNDKAGQSTTNTAQTMADAMQQATEKITGNVTDMGLSFDGFGKAFDGVKDKVTTGLEAIAAVMVGVRATMVIQTGLMMTQGLSPLAALIKATPWGIVVTAAIIGIVEVMKAINDLKQTMADLDASRQANMKTDEQLISRLHELEGQPKTPERDAKIQSIKNALMLPSFATGVADFTGGLAYVHQGEVLANLSRGTTVIPKNQVDRMLAGGGSQGGTVENHYHLDFGGAIVGSSTQLRDMVHRGIQDLDRQFRANGKAQILKPS